MRSPLPRLLFSFTVGLIGLGALAFLTDWATLGQDFLPLLFFILLSFIVKRAGVYSHPDTLHSLVGIVDLAAVFIFGPVPGAWVPALSSLFYILINNIEYRRRKFLVLFESPIFNAGLKALMGLACGYTFIGLGGLLPRPDSGLSNFIPSVAAMVLWYLLDNLGWGLWETIRLGTKSFSKVFRETLAASILVELIPLPFSMVIAVVYTSFGGLTSVIFLVLAAGLIQVAFVIQRYAISEERLNRRTRELAVLNEFNQAVTQAGFNTDRVIELLLEFASRVLYTELVRVELYDTERDAVQVSAEMSNAKIEWNRQLRPLSPQLEFMRDHPASLVAGDLRAQKLPFGFAAQVNKTPARAAIFVPMLTGEMVIGLVTAMSIQPHAMSMVNARTLNVLAGQAAVALENARLYAVEQRRATQLAIVSEVGARVAQLSELDELLPQVVREIQNRFGYNPVHVLLEQDNRDLLIFATTHPLGEQWRQRGERIRHAEGITGWVAANAEPLVVADVLQDSRYLPGPDAQTINTRSELAVPLIVGERVVGVLDVQSEQAGAFGPEDLFVIQTLGTQLAIAIENARLYEAQQIEAYYLNALLNVAENLAEQESLQDALDTVVRLTTLLVGVQRASVFLFDPNAREFRAAKAYGLSPALENQFRRLRFPLDGVEHDVFMELWESREPVQVANAQSSDLVRPNLATLFELESIVLFPLIARGEMVGALGVDQGEKAHHFSDEEIRVLYGIANQAAVAIERARLGEQAELKKRLDYELGLAHQIQTSFLPPRPPRLPEYDIAAAWHAARMVGGDFYDMIPLQHDRLGLVIADVSDKGLAAALFMALTRTVIRTMAIGKPTPREALERANDVIIADAQSDMFVTAFYAVLDTMDGTISFVNAGHNPPLVYQHKTRTVTPVRDHGIALGIMSNIELPQGLLQLECGDVLVLYTDGVTDALAPSGQDEFGMSRLTETVREHGDKPAQRLVDEILGAVHEFVHDAPQFDDLTLLVVRRNL